MCLQYELQLSLYSWGNWNSILSINSPLIKNKKLELWKLPFFSRNPNQIQKRKQNCVWISSVLKVPQFVHHDDTFGLCSWLTLLEPLENQHTQKVSLFWIYWVKMSLHARNEFFCINFINETVKFFIEYLFVNTKDCISLNLIQFSAKPKLIQKWLENRFWIPNVIASFSITLYDETCGFYSLSCTKS